MNIGTYFSPRIFRRTGVALFFLLLSLLTLGLSVAHGAQYISTQSGNWGTGVWNKNLTGTISLSSGSATVTGSGTYFTTELAVGDRLVLQSASTTVVGTVSAIASNTSLTLTANAGSTTSGAYAKQTVQYLTGTISATSGSATVTGTSTLFSTQLTVGDRIVLQSATGTLIGTVASIASNTSLTLTANASASASGAYAKAVSTPNSSSDSVTIASGNHITLLGSYSAATIQLNNSSNGSNSSSITLNNNSLTVSGAVNLNAGATGNNSTIIYVRNGTLTCASLAIVGAASGNRVCELRDSTGGNVNVSGDVSWGGTSNSKWTHVSGGSASVGGNFPSGGTVTNATGASMTFSGSGTQTIGGAYTFYNVTINKTNATDTVRLGAGLTVQNDLTVTKGVFDDNGNQISGPGSSGTLTIGSSGELMVGSISTATTFPSFNNKALSNGTVTWAAGPNQTIPTMAPYQWGHLKVKRGKKTFSGNDTISGSISVASGAELAAGSTTLSVKGNFTNDGTFTKGTSTVKFSGTTSQTISGSSTTSFNSVEVNNSSFPVLMNSSINTSGTLTLRSGSLSIGSNTLGIGGTLTTVSGGLTGGTSSNIVICDSTGGSAGQLTLPAVELSKLTVNRNDGMILGGPVTLNGSADLIIGLFVVGKNNITIKRPMHGTTTNFHPGDSSSITIGPSDTVIVLPPTVTTISTLVIDNSSGVVVTGPLVVKDSLTLSSGQLAGATAGDTVQLASGAVVTPNGGTVSGTIKYNYPLDVVYQGSTATATGAELPTDATSVRNVTINNPAGVTLNSNLTVNGDLMIAAGSTFTLGTHTVNRGSTGGTLNIGAGATLNIGGTGGFPSSYTTHTISGTSTVVYNGTNQTISPESYGNLTFGGTGTKILSSGTTSISGNFVVTGSPTVAANGGTIQINGTGAQSIAGTTFNNLTFNGTGTKTMTSSGTLTGNLTITTGTVDLTSYSLDRTTNGGVFSMASGTTLRIGGTAGFPTNFATNTLNAASTVEFYGSTQAIGAVTYGNLMTSGGVKSMTGNASVAGTLTMDSYINSGSDTLTIGTSDTNLGSLSYTSGGCVGCMKRWFAQAAVSDVLYPVAEVGRYVPNNLSFTGAPSTSGTVVTCFIPSNPGTRGLPAMDGATSIKNVAREGYWYIHNSDGLTGGTYTVELTGTNFGGIQDYTTVHIVKRPNTNASWQVLGSHMAGMGSNSSPRARRGGLTSFSEFGLGGGGDNVLPVLMSGFDGAWNGSAVELDWRTASEHDNAGFILSRAAVGTEPGLDTTFAPIASYLNDPELKGLGTSPIGKSYHFLDADRLTPGAIYRYRVTQVDVDGSRIESEKTVEVAVPQTTGRMSLAQNFPNPAVRTTTIGFELPEPAAVELTLFDALGHAVRTERLQGTAGENRIELDVQGLAAGRYLYRVTAGTSVRTRSLLIGN